jgi:hypothetical protein
MKELTGLLIIILLSFCACSDTVVNEPGGDNLIKELRLIDDLNSSLIFKSEARILNVRLEKDILTIRVNYSGGCRKHILELYSNKTLKESNPPQIDMRLSHDAQNDFCDMLVTDTLRVNLQPLKSFLISQYNQASGEVILNIYSPDMILFENRPLYIF